MRHSQKADKALMQCPKCKADKCAECVDATRFLLGYLEPICQCTRRSHSGEPRDSQILDPESGVVLAPGLSVSPDGQVTKHE